MSHASHASHSSHFAIGKARSTRGREVRKVFYFRCLEIGRFGGFSILSLSRDHSLAQQKRIGPPVNRRRQKAQGRRMSAPVKRSRRKAWRYRNECAASFKLPVHQPDAEDEKTERSEEPQKEAERMAAGILYVLPSPFLACRLFFGCHGAGRHKSPGGKLALPVGDVCSFFIHGAWWWVSYRSHPCLPCGGICTTTVHAQNYSIIRCTRYG